ncbi:MAG: YdcH family protein [Azospirillaceae bacterium]
MSHDAHDLASELPEHRQRIHVLKVENAHFRRLMGDYNDLDQSILRLETSGQPIDDMAIEEMKRRRLALKDELFAMIRAT